MRIGTGVVCGDVAAGVVLVARDEAHLDASAAGGIGVVGIVDSADGVGHAHAPVERVVLIRRRVTQRISAVDAGLPVDRIVVVHGGSTIARVSIGRRAAAVGVVLIMQGVSHQIVVSDIRARSAVAMRRTGASDCLPIIISDLVVRIRWRAAAGGGGVIQRVVAIDDSAGAGVGGDRADRVIAVLKRAGTAAEGDVADGVV